MALGKTFVWGWPAQDMDAAKALDVTASNRHEEYIMSRYRYVLD